MAQIGIIERTKRMVLKIKRINPNRVTRKNVGIFRNKQWNELNKRIQGLPFGQKIEADGMLEIMKKNTQNRQLESRIIKELGEMTSKEGKIIEKQKLPEEIQEAINKMIKRMPKTKKWLRIIKAKPMIDSAEKLLDLDISREELDEKIKTSKDQRIINLRKKFSLIFVNEKGNLVCRNPLSKIAQKVAFLEKKKNLMK